MSLREDRAELGADILQRMDADNSVEFPNKHALAKAMQEYFKKYYLAEVKDSGYRWRPDEDYWKYKLSEIQRALRQEQLYFGYDREWGDFTGAWCFMSKPQYTRMLRRDAAGLATRTENYNEKLEDGQQRWKLDLPAFNEPPLLPPPIH